MVRLGPALHYAFLQHSRRGGVGRPYSEDEVRLESDGEAGEQPPCASHRGALLGRLWVSSRVPSVSWGWLWGWLGAAWT